MTRFDIVHAADPRYRGGTASALRGEMTAAAQYGLTTALLPYVGPRSFFIRGFDPRLSRTQDATGTPLLDPASAVGCDILLAHHPQVFARMPATPVALRPERVVCVLHHPLYDGAHRPQFDPARLIRALEATFAAPVSLAPISPLIRAQLSVSGLPSHQVLAHDLPNVIDAADWPMRSRPAPRDRAVIGRHARSDPLKWPDTAEEVRAAYPLADHIEIRVLGDVALPEEMAMPPNWSARPFTDTGVADFLSGLDFYVYFHSGRWVEAFGLSIAEAMLSGLVTLLPPSFEPVFGEAAVYCQPPEVRGVIEHFLARPDDYARQSRTARRLMLERHSLDAFGPRMQRLYGDLGLAPPACLAAPVPRPAVLAPPPERRRILMVTGNGIGLGHITRLMAIAKRLPDWIEPVFLTLSLASGLIRAAGFSADYLMGHRKAGVTEKSWNEAFAVELMAAIDATNAKMVVLDGNAAFFGMVDVIASRRDIAWVWVRRGLWQPHQALSPKSNNVFDMVIEPGEFAGDEDGGPTAGLPGVEHVGPILLCDPDERVDRGTAAAHLGVDPGRQVVAVQLGSRQNFDTAPLRAEIFRALAATDAQVIEIANPLAKPDPLLPGEPPRSPIYPVFPWSRAIDLMITAAGYNAFHESIYGGIPSIFVPNAATEMDDQTLRAAYARASGHGLMLTPADAPRAATVVATGLSPEFGDKVRQRAARLAYRPGAVDAARLMVEFLLSTRTDLPLHRILPRRAPD